jgi:hypothetical protein
MLRAESLQVGLALFLCSLFAISAETHLEGSPSPGSGYSFARLLDDSGDLTRIDAPVISNTGVVAFGASVRSGARGVFALQDDVLTLIGDSTRFPDFILHR